MRFRCSSSPFCGEGWRHKIERNGVAGKVGELSWFFPVAFSSVGFGSGVVFVQVSVCVLKWLIFTSVNAFCEVDF